MNANQLRRHYTALRDSGKLSGSIARAVRLRQQRDDRRITDRTRSPIGMLEANVARRSRPTLLSLGNRLSYQFLTEAQNEFRRYRNWSDGATAVVDLGDEVYRHSPWRIEETGDRGGPRKRSTFRRGVLVRCYATCPDHREAVVVVGNMTRRFRAPRGFRWDVDARGLMLRTTRRGAKLDRFDEYHPDAGDLIFGGPKFVVEQLKAAAVRRRAAAAVARRNLGLVRAAEREGAHVCLADSLRAGNCRAGTLDWVRMHKLDASRHYRPSEVLRLANGDAMRVSIVVAMAIKRHREEMRRGHAELSDHRA